MVVPGSVTLSADLSDHPCVNSVELTVGAGPGVWVGPDVGVRLGVDVAPTGVGVFVFGAFGLLALAEPPIMLNINASTSTAVRNMNK